MGGEREEGGAAESRRALAERQSKQDCQISYGAKRGELAMHGW